MHMDKMDNDRAKMGKDLLQVEPYRKHELWALFEKKLSWTCHIILQYLFNTDTDGDMTKCCEN